MTDPLKAYRALLDGGDTDFLEDIVELYDQKLENHTRRIFAYNEQLTKLYPKELIIRWNNETLEHLQGFSIGIRADRVYFRSAFFLLHMSWSKKFDEAKTTSQMEAIRVERDAQREEQLKTQLASVDKFYDQDFTQHTKLTKEFLSRNLASEMPHGT